MIEDSPAFCRELLLLLDEIPGAEVAGTAASVPDAIRLIEQERPDVLFLDLFIQQGTGIDVLRHFAQRGKPVQAALMTSVAREDLGRHSLSIGIRWILDKTEIADAIARVCEEARKCGDSRDEPVYDL